MSELPNDQDVVSAFNTALQQQQTLSQQNILRQWPALAPRDAYASSSSSASRDRRSGAASGRPPRLSHRSRAGCWTCRGRKVKCDEVHPRCGPCQRLNRQCDWDHRWNFSDATTSTQRKYGNVKTDGNSVWDPSTSSPSSPRLPTYDDLPNFSVLTNDEDRERKAGSQLPGTYGVVVTPGSFSDLPEYASASDSRRASIKSHPSSFMASPRPSTLRRARTDPNVVVLERFEDSTVSIPPMPSPSTSLGFPGAISNLSISTSSPLVSPRGGSGFPIRPTGRDDRLSTHFRQYIVRRLVLPLLDGSYVHAIAPSSTRDMFELEASRFEPLHHAICAISALNLAYNGRASLEDAMQHYHSALSTSATPTTPDDLLSDGVFLRHFLLLIYDICVPVSTDDGGADMWEGHLNHLLRIATQRRARLGHEPHGYILWTICQLDMYACLMGNGTCDFIRSVLNQDMLPALEQQIPDLGLTGRHGATGASNYLPEEAAVFPPVLNLYQGVVIHTAKLAQAAQGFRAERNNNPVSTPGIWARWQANVAHLQGELFNFWAQAYPDFLPTESPQAAYNLPPRVRCVFENAFILFQAAVIYSRTSMFPGQRSIPVANQPSINTDTENRCYAILSLTTSILQHYAATQHTTSPSNPEAETRPSERRDLVFPLLISGIVSSNPESKSKAADLIRQLESPAANFPTTPGPTTPGAVLSPPLPSSQQNSAGGGIGQNTYRMRQLLSVVCEEQRRVVAQGGRMENVDWMFLARDRGLMVVNCGL